jgi:hypothetical protein
MAFGKGFSADTSGGWKNHYHRTLRWENRSREALNDLPHTNFQDAIDFSLAYFVWSHSLRDWLVNSKLAQHEIWALCSDVANRTRHFELNRNPTDKDWSAYREYDPFGPLLEQRERHMANIMFDGKKWRIVYAISASAQMWREILGSETLG